MNSWPTFSLRVLEKRRHDCEVDQFDARDLRRSFSVATTRPRPHLATLETLLALLVLVQPASANASLWLKSPCGLEIIAHDQLESWSEHPEKRIQVRVLDVFDGVRSGLSPFSLRAAKPSDGRLWFAVEDGGLEFVDPGHLKDNPFPPQVWVEKVIADRNIYEPGSSLRLPALTRDLEINDTALSFTLPKKVRFRYKLEGMDHDWQETGPPRKAFYNILPAFYQTNWFLIFCVAAAGCLAWTGFQWRVRQMAARLDLQFRERVSERTRVAQDLHDTLLQGFLSASMQLQVAATHLPDDWPAKTMVGEVLDLMRSAIEDGRNALRGLRSWQEETCDLTQAFSRISQELAIQRQANYGVIVEGQPRSLHPVVRDEVYRIAREAVVNAFRHSQASGIELELKYATDQLQILVRDDGCGIDPQVLHAGREGHWGLPGMRERAERIGAKLKVLSRPAGGTEMELSVPGDVAFRLYSPSRVRRKARWHRRKAEPGDREQKDRRAV
jgi:signal transduction histidine kinase